MPAAQAYTPSAAAEALHQSPLALWERVRVRPFAKNCSDRIYRMNMIRARIAGASGTGMYAFGGGIYGGWAKNIATETTKDSEINVILNKTKDLDCVKSWL